MGTTLYCQRLWKHPLAHICSSLTEAFCIAILEAASCGLLTVSTRVGGVPEVVPDDMIVLAEPDPSDMVRAIQRAITMLPKIDPQVMHNRMRELYSWHDVSKRTEIVYDRALKCSDQNLLERLSRYLSCGAWAGKIFCLVMIFNFLLWHLLELWQMKLRRRPMLFFRATAMDWRDVAENTTMQKITIVVILIIFHRKKMLT
ncbi:phosphatidylinositol N-acetylglucosaminyltransferase subunit A isoform X3 [Lathyrus oleraceus]|uniref:phosphatidylinositol N-acetylglucosaminyltransferase subunit A isoform X3 n=1 Tax=Pisum sativum TaxID=3888 RepID=UPI0021CEA943|nr:phosphatidylinositol N-acetylglucosaminyltransferase subunit A-like isoform X3 [Pisum sativum]XP_050916231.1 phosphatidylinositol N-acetylglucosaminyltransferase subunit A-like isoform X3 [Pisum sativum]XP_050916237.1 phosphatidylinositol N-acetylglucosaminyltransferase subunit A-like isoform X3 [Pisum sativum]